MLTLTSLGGAGEVTGSCHLLHMGKKRFLLDCGMHQGGETTSRLRREGFRFRPRDIDGVILSHAHLDHSGLLPKLYNRGFRGKIYCTPATRNLLAIMLDDAANIYFRDLEHANLRKRRSGSSGRVWEPEYQIEDVLAVLEHCAPVDYRQWITLAKGLKLRFLDAGHILGSAISELAIDHRQQEKRLVYSGDLGKVDSVLMCEPEVPEKADLVLMESTYGNRDHRTVQDTITELADILREAERQKGNILMPAFAVGRTQELLFHLGCLYHAGHLKNWQVFLDSPMAIEVTRLYSQWLDAMDEEDQRLLAHYGARTLEQFLPSLTLSETVEDSVGINRMESGAIIIAGSGMCTGGRIRHHFKQRLWKDNNHIVFSGFQAKGTLGRHLVDGADHVRMFGNKFAVRARVHTLGGFSAHAGQRGLLSWASAIGGNPAFRLVHGEETALQTLCEKLREQGLRADVAVKGEKVVLEGE